MAVSRVAHSAPPARDPADRPRRERPHSGRRLLRGGSRQRFYRFWRRAGDGADFHLRVRSCPDARDRGDHQCGDSLADAGAVFGWHAGGRHPADGGRLRARNTPWDRVSTPARSRERTPDRRRGHTGERHRVLVRLASGEASPTRANDAGRRPQRRDERYRGRGRPAGRALAARWPRRRGPRPCGADRLRSP